jgi:hypothetical protein
MIVNQWNVECLSDVHAAKKLKPGLHVHLLCLLTSWVDEESRMLLAATDSLLMTPKTCSKRTARA